MHQAATAPWRDVWSLSSQVCTAGHAIVRASHAGPAPWPSSLNLSTPVPVQFNGEALVLALHTANAVHALRRIEPFDVAAEHGLLQHVAVAVSSQQATLACKHRHHTPDKSLIALCSSLLIGIGSGTSISALRFQPCSCEGSPSPASSCSSTILPPPCPKRPTRSPGRHSQLARCPCAEPPRTTRIRLCAWRPQGPGRSGAPTACSDSVQTSGRTRRASALAHCTSLSAGVPPAPREHMLDNRIEASRASLHLLAVTLTLPFAGVRPEVVTNKAKPRSCATTAGACSSLKVNLMSCSQSAHRHTRCRACGRTERSRRVHH